MANPFDQFDTHQPVYGAAPPPTQPLELAGKQLSNTRTQQEIDAANATAAANTTKANAEAKSASIDAQTKQEAYDAAHPKGTGATVIGPDSLKSLSVPDQELVKALADGRLAFPAGFALKAPWWQQKLEQVAQFDPTFDATNFNNRAKARATLLNGKVGTSANALNTAIGHLGLLNTQISGTASHDFTPINTVENYLAQKFGDPGITNFKDTSGKLASELTSVYRNGGGAEQDIVRQLQSLDPNASEAQKTSVIRNSLDLLASKQAANLYQYNLGAGGKPAVDLLDPQARQVLDQFPDIRDKYFAPPAGGLSGHAAALLQANGGTPPSAPPPSNGAGGAPPPIGPAGPANDTVTRVPTADYASVGQGPHFGVAQGATRDVFDQVTASGLNTLIHKGASIDQANAYAKSQGYPAEIDPQTYQAAVTYAKSHPGWTAASASRTVPTTLRQRLNASPLAAGIVGAGDAATMGFGPQIAGGISAVTGGDYVQGRDTYSANQNALSGLHPEATLAGNLVGGTAAALGGEAALGGMGMAPSAGRSLIADIGYGTASGAGNNPQNRLLGAGEGAVAGAIGSGIGQGLAKGGSAVLRGVTDKSVNSLMDAGTPMTVGQVVSQSGRPGAIIKGAEDRLSGFTGVGDMIQARRTEGYQAFNTKAFDKALEPVDGSVNGAVGEEAVASAHQTVKEAFLDALKGKEAIPDAQFVTAARGPLERLASIKRNDLGPEIVQQIEESTKDLFDPQNGALSGENMQSFLEALRQIRQSYKNDPLYARTIKPSVQGIENAVTDMFARQAPEVVPAFNKAKAAYRRVSILADAVDKGKNTEGVFTPAQLGTADRTNAAKYDGKLSSSSGESPFFDYQRAGQNVLPGKVPDSGTAGRIALAKGASIPMLGATLGYLGGDTKTGAESGLGLTGILALAYTRTGQKRLAAMLLSRNPQARALAEQITKRLPIAGAAGTALTQTSVSP